MTILMVRDACLGSPQDYDERADRDQWAVSTLDEVEQDINLMEAEPCFAGRSEISIVERCIYMGRNSNRYEEGPPDMPPAPRPAPPPPAVLLDAPAPDSASEPSASEGAGSAMRGGMCPFGCVV